MVLAADPCYGACDLVHDKMKMMVELVAHMGHSQMNIDSGMPTEFIDVRYDGDPELKPVLPILTNIFQWLKKELLSKMMMNNYLRKKPKIDFLMRLVEWLH